MPKPSFTVVPRRQVLVRFKPGEEEKESSSTSKIADVVDAVRDKVESVEFGNVSNTGAEKRANIGNEREPTFPEAQAFDGPLPETINGRAAMIGVLSGLGAEFTRGIGLRQQIMEAPNTIVLSILIIAVASAVPVLRGYTRKEPFANSFWSPKAENINGRLAMLGFASIIATEAIFHQTTVQFWGNLFK
jgi:hypothetical protein